MSILPKNGISLQKKPTVHHTKFTLHIKKWILVVGEMAQRSMFFFFCTQNFGIFKVSSFFFTYWRWFWCVVVFRCFENEFLGRWFHALPGKDEAKGRAHWFQSYSNYTNDNLFDDGQNEIKKSKSGWQNPYVNDSQESKDQGPNQGQRDSHNSGEDLVDP